MCMRLHAALLCGLLLFGCAPAVASCNRIEAAHDAQGLRVRNQNGHWIYVTHGDFVWSEVARFPEPFGPWFAQELSGDWLKKHFGGCSETIAAVLPAFLFADQHSLRRDNRGEPNSGQIVSVRLQPQQAPRGHLVTTAGTDLLDLRGALYAVDGGLAICGITATERAAALACTAETRSRLSGVVRRIADRFSEIGVTKVEWPSNYFFRDGKLRADFRVLTPSGEQTLRFEE